MNQEKSKTIFWELLSGSVTSMIIGFTYGGWMFGSNAFSKGEEIARVAIVDRLTPMGKAKFNQDPEKKINLIEMNSMDTWYTEKHLKDQGWQPYFLKKHQITISQITAQLDYENEALRIYPQPFYRKEAFHDHC
jgi:hypothetical protein